MQGLLLLGANLMSFVERFSDVSTVLLTVLLSGEEAVPKDVQCKDLVASN